MAEAMTRHLAGDAWAAASAGINPLGFITRETLQVLGEIGVATVGLRSKGLAEINFQEYRLIVNLSHYSLDALIPSAFQGLVIRWPVIDPYGGSLELYRQARDAIRRLIVEELRHLPLPLPPLGQN